MATTISEENYLKTIFHLAETEGEAIGTNLLAAELKTTAASVTEMLKRLSAKRMVAYRPYRGVSLTSAGKRAALQTIRRHRLWELFLVKTLRFRWDEVHALAEQLEHVQSDVLTDRLEVFLEHPAFDPHGDPIPDSKGRMPNRQEKRMSELKPGESGLVSSVGTDDPSFLLQLDDLGIGLGTLIHIEDRYPFDQSARVTLQPGKKRIHLAERLMQQLFIQPPADELKKSAGRNSRQRVNA